MRAPLYHSLVYMFWIFPKMFLYTYIIFFLRSWSPAAGPNLLDNDTQILLLYTRAVWKFRARVDCSWAEVFDIPMYGYIIYILYGTRIMRHFFFNLKKFLLFSYESQLFFSVVGYFIWNTNVEEKLMYHYRVVFARCIQ